MNNESEGQWKETARGLLTGIVQTQELILRRGHAICCLVHVSSIAELGKLTQGWLTHKPSVLHKVLYCNARWNSKGKTLIFFPRSAHFICGITRNTVMSGSLSPRHGASSGIRWAGHVARMVEGRGVHRVLVGKPVGKRPLGRPRRRWEDNIKMGLQEVGGDCGDWMELAQDRDRWRALVSTVMNLRVPKMRGISWLAAKPVSFSRTTLLHGVSK